MKRILAFALLATAGLVSTPGYIGASTQRDRFINVEGATLHSRIDAAIRQGTSGREQFWTAYSFDVRPGVAVDAEFNNFRGDIHTTHNGSVTIGFSDGVEVETRNLGIFLLRDQSGAITRLEIYNLDRVHEYSGYPVYWLGRATNDESLDLLKSLALGQPGAKISEHATMAIGLHDDKRVPGMLKDFVRSSTTEKVRDSAVFWLGQFGGEHEFLAELVRSDRESTELRKNAAFAIGISKDQEAIAVLKNLFASVTGREVRKQIIFAISINKNSDESVDFLIQAATNDSDADTRKQALFWLGQKAGERSLKVLGNLASNSDGDTEVQKQAVFAISQRRKDESVPLLIKIAKTHPKAEVRKQAMFWLGQTGDERAITFFKEILAK
jgi:HEAT repeat protein